MDTYTHKVQYYETDKMGFVHHSNYIRWFEEARNDYFDSVGAPYTETENRGFLCPVLSVSCNYKQSVQYGETVRIAITLTEFGNVRFCMSYAVYDAQSGALRAEGTTEHCFLDQNGKVISIKKSWPEMFRYLKEQVVGE